ncbi:MAG: 1,2-phenylacetyl-CoA epoxidase subunit PaaD [Bacteroidota bacterium]|jgi:ring-1,2-phenylacetyl-CoA epoxidase subunit PaaD|nr:phenylacetate-CoA oxygenase subunit PaaJ [Sphingobacteriales bacterium]
MLSEAQIWQALEVVKDPEIPTLSMVDMGIITKVEIRGESDVFVEMTPTFSGCPAIKMMEGMVAERLKEIGIEKVEVVTTFDKPWDSNKLTERGLMCLKKHGLAPPPKHKGEITQELLEHVACPFCGSKNTETKSPFGPTLCRSLHYCNNCLQAFEQFKPVV